MNTPRSNNNTVAGRRRRVGALIAGVAVVSSVISGLLVGAIDDSTSDALNTTTESATVATAPVRDYPAGPTPLHTSSWRPAAESPQSRVERSAPRDYPSGPTPVHSCSWRPAD